MTSNHNTYLYYSKFITMILYVILASVNTLANETYIRLQEKLLQRQYINKENVDLLLNTIDLRRSNRESIHSMQASFIEMTFSSNLQLQKLSDRLSHGIIPYHAFPNPDVKSYFIKKSERAHYGFYSNLYRIQRFFLDDEEININRDKILYAPVSIRREFVRDGSLFVILDEVNPLTQEAPPSVKSLEGIISRTGEHEWLTKSFNFYPEYHEIHTLERKVVDIADATSTLRDIYIQNKDNEDILSIILEYPNQEFHTAHYSLNKNGLLISQELILPFADGQGTHHRIINTSNVSFYETESENGNRIFVPATFERIDYIDGGFREQLIFSLDTELSSINREIPENEFVITVPNEQVVFHNHVSRNDSLTEPIFYKNYNDLPLGVKNLIKTQESINVLNISRLILDESYIFEKVKNIQEVYKNSDHNNSKRIKYELSNHSPDPKLYYEHSVRAGFLPYISTYLLASGAAFLLIGLSFRIMRQNNK